MYFFFFNHEKTLGCDYKHKRLDWCWACCEPTLWPSLHDGPGRHCRRSWWRRRDQKRRYNPPERRRISSHHRTGMSWQDQLSHMLSLNWSKILKMSLFFFCDTMCLRAWEPQEGVGTDRPFLLGSEVVWTSTRIMESERPFFHRYNNFFFLNEFCKNFHEF